MFVLILLHLEHKFDCFCPYPHSKMGLVVKLPSKLAKANLKSKQLNLHHYMHAIFDILAQNHINTTYEHDNQ